MALIGKISAYIEINSGGKVLHDLIRHTPNNLSFICPDKVHSCDHVSGGRGVVGSIIQWTFTHDGKKQTAKEIVEEIDESNHKIVLKVIGGEIVEEMYKAITITFHCETKDGKQYGVWTMDFERPNTTVPYPSVYVDYLCSILSDMDHHSTSSGK